MDVVFRHVKMESQLVRSPTRIDTFILLPSSKVFCAALWFWASSVIEARLGSMYAINNRLTWQCQSTLIASKCDRLDRTMLLLAFLDYPGVFFVLAVIRIVDSTFRRLPVTLSHFCFSCIEQPFYFRLDNVEWNGNVTVFLPLLHTRS